MFPGSTLQVIYEDFINRPNEILQDIYNMLSLPVPAAVQDWLDAEMYDIKGNSVDIASKWRQVQSPELINQIYAICSEFYEEVNFRWR